MSKEILIILIAMIAIFLSGILLGLIISKDSNQDYTNNKYDGLWLKGNLTKEQAQDRATEKDSGGNWICVNIKGMGYSRMVEVINHEVGHEIFAEMCEKNITKCFEIAEDYK